MGKYKLTYFNLRGIAEPIRFLFAYAGVPFEDHQIDTSTWVEVKKTIKWQQLPFLEFDGKVLTQALVIQNYLAEEFGLSLKDPWERAKCNEISAALDDMRLQIKPFILAKFVEQNPKHATELKESLLSSSFPLFLGNINEIVLDIRKNKKDASTTNFIFGNAKPTVADFALAHFTQQWESILEEPSLLEKYEPLKKVQKEVFDIPQISKWIKERPNFPF